MPGKRAAPSNRSGSMRNSAERELRAIEKKVGDLRNAIDSLQSMASVLRRTIGEMEGRANDLLGATEQAVETGVLESQLRDGIHQQLLPRLCRLPRHSSSK